MGRVLMACAALCVSGQALAVYKCEENGRVTYGDQPCDGGRAVTLPSTAPDASSTRRQAERDASTLKSLESERHKREAVEERELRSSSRQSAARHKRCAAHAAKQKRANQEVAATSGLANEKARQKARRVTEDYEAACGRWYERELGLAR